MTKEKYQTRVYDFSYFIGSVFVGLAKLLWSGIVGMSKKHLPVLLLYIVTIIFTELLYVLNYNYLIGISVIFSLGIIFGIYKIIEEYPLRKKQEYFLTIFKEMGLYKDGEVPPYFLYEEQLSEYATSLTFNTLVPLSTWQSKKEVLEMYLDNIILDIRQSRTNQRIIQLILENKSIPAQIDWDDSYIDKEKNILNIGIGSYGVVGMSLESQAHAFVAGETGSGKSNIMKCLIHQAIVKGYAVKLIDFKRGVSFSSFAKDLEIYYDYDEAKKVLELMVHETRKRLDMFRELGVDNFKDYNAHSNTKMKRTVIFIDELAELLKIRDREMSHALNDSIETLTRLSRATGIHLIMGIQRPDSTIISGQIKNNVSFRVCGRFVDIEPSRIMLGDMSASSLPNIKGRFLVKDDCIEEVQSFYYYAQARIYKNIKEPQEPEKKPPLETLEQESIPTPTISSKEVHGFDFSDVAKE